MYTRARSNLPPPAETRNVLLGRIGRRTHLGFYVLIDYMVLTGFATAFGAGLFPIFYDRAKDVLPPELSSLPQRTAHGVIVTLLVALNALYVAAEVYHQIALKDGLLHRMWFGNGSA